jgi:hypothetical protein
MTIIDKMLKAYFHVAEGMDKDKGAQSWAASFHRNKKLAFFVEARRLDKDGCLQGEVKK